MVALLTVTAGSPAVSAPPMGVFEHTREVGILRCLSGRDPAHPVNLQRRAVVLAAPAGHPGSCLAD
jgi:hypothetical protein